MIPAIPDFGRYKLPIEDAPRNKNYGAAWALAGVVALIAAVVLVGGGGFVVYQSAKILATTSFSAPIGILQASVGLLMISKGLMDVIPKVLDCYRNMRYHLTNLQPEAK